MKKEPEKRNALEEDRRKRKVDHAQIDNLRGLFAFLINYAFIWVVGLAFYFGITYPVRYNDPSFLKQSETYSSLRKEWNLDMWNDASNEQLEEAMQHFYFDGFKETIEQKYNEANETNYTIVHIYNIRIYHLPDHPTPSDYQTEYFAYMLNADGSINPDVLAISKYDELGPRGREDLHSILFSSYLGIEINLREFSPAYKYSVNYILQYGGLCKMLSFLGAMIANYLILPLFFHFGTGLGEKIMKIGYANKRSGYAASYWKQPLKLLILSLPALIGTYYWNLYFIFILLIFPYLLDMLFHLLSANRVGLADKFLFLVPVDLTYEKLYKNEAELLQDGETVLMTYSEEYTSTLSNVETISLEDRGDGAH